MMIKKVCRCCLVLVLLPMSCFADEKTLAIEPAGFLSIEKTLWGYEGEENLALGFCGGAIYLVNLGTSPSIAPLQNADYFSFFFVSFFNAGITLGSQEDQINGLLFPVVGVGFYSFPDRAEEGTRALRLIDNCWSPSGARFYSLPGRSGEDTRAIDGIAGCWSPS